MISTRQRQITQCALSLRPTCITETSFRVDFTHYVVTAKRAFQNNASFLKNNRELTQIKNGDCVLIIHKLEAFRNYTEVIASYDRKVRRNIQCDSYTYLEQCIIHASHNHWCKPLKHKNNHHYRCLVNDYENVITVFLAIILKV